MQTGIRKNSANSLIQQRKSLVPSARKKVAVHANQDIYITDNVCVIVFSAEIKNLIVALEVSIFHESDALALFVEKRGTKWKADLKVEQSAEPFHSPLAVKTGEAGLAGEELLHGGLFDVALLGDELVQRTEQRINITQRLRDGALIPNRRRW